VKLFRAVYSRNGSCGGMTFAVPSSLFAAEEATRLAETLIMPYARWLDPNAKLLTVMPADRGRRASKARL